MFEEKDDDKLEAEKYEKYKKQFIDLNIKWPIYTGSIALISSILLLSLGWDNIVCKAFGLILIITSPIAITVGLYRWWKEKKN